MGGRGAKSSRVTKTGKKYKGSIKSALDPHRRTALRSYQHGIVGVRVGKAKFQNGSNSQKLKRSQAVLNGIKMPKNSALRDDILSFSKSDLKAYAKRTGDHYPSLAKMRSRIVKYRNSKEPNLTQYKASRLKDLKATYNANKSNFGKNDPTTIVSRQRYEAAKRSKTGTHSPVEDKRVYEQFKKNGGKLRIWR